MHLVEPKNRAWTTREYHQMGEFGWFEGQRVQLVDGKIVVMSPQNFPHSIAVDRVSKLLHDAVGRQFWVRSQLPLVLSEVSEPEPDVSVIAGRREDYSDHPTTALLVVEVSDSTLYFDRKQKIRTYAQARIPHYWIVNLVNRTIEVYEQPGEASGEPIYADRRTVQADGTIEFPAEPSVQFAAKDFLP